MREQYWSMLTDTKFKLFYYWEYRDLSQKIDFWLKVIATFTTSSGIACLLLKKDFPIVWTTLIIISQTYQSVEHLLPFKERITRVNFLIPPLSYLINEIERDWAYIDTYSEKEIIGLIYKYKDSYIKIDDQFISSFPFPHRKLCTNKATKLLKEYCEYHYLPREEGNNNGEQQENDS